MRRKMTTFKFSTFIAYVPQKFQVVLEKVGIEDVSIHTWFVQDYQHL